MEVKELEAREIMHEVRTLAWTTPGCSWHTGICVTVTA